MGPQDDPASRVFGRHGRTPDPSVIDLALGSLRGFPALTNLWKGLEADGAGLLRGLDGYPGTQGPLGLLEALAELWESERGAPADPRHFVATHGALDAIGHALATLPAGSPVIFAVPGFDYRLAIARVGCLPVPLLWPVGRGLSEFNDSLEAQLPKVGRCAAIIVCLPSNPGGVVAATAEWERLRTLAARNGALLVVDDLYRFTGARTDGDVEGADVVVVDSLSKRFGGPGLRLGYAKASGPRLAKVRASMGRTSVGVSSLVATVGERALRRYLHQPAIAAEIRSGLARRRDAVRAALMSSQRSRLHLTDAGFYGCLQTPVLDSDALVRRLRDRGVLVTPGAGLFGALPADVDRGQPFIRFCVGSDPRIAEAFDIICEEVLAAEELLAPHPMRRHAGAHFCTPLTERGSWAEPAHVPTETRRP